MAQIAARIHMLSDLRGLADVLTLLVLRSWQAIHLLNEPDHS